MLNQVANFKKWKKEVLKLNQFNLILMEAQPLKLIKLVASSFL
jgi:hypothetical protein